MTIQRPAFVFSIANVSALTVAVACNVFQPPPSGSDAGLHEQTHGGATGSGGRSDSGGQQGSTGGRDASVSTAGTVGDESGAGGSVSSGGAQAVADAAPDATTSSGPTAPWWPHKTAKGCLSAGVPKSTDRVPSDPGATIAPVYFAMNRFRLGAVDEKPDPTNMSLTYLPPDPNAWEDIGFDLDGACTNSATCEDSKGNLIKETVCSNSQTIPFDGNKCIDNSIGKLFNIAATAPTVGEWFGLTENDWNCEMWRGGFSIIFKVSNYNGQYNDDSVTLDMYTSTGLQVLPQWYCRKAIDQPLATDWNAHAPWPSKSHWIISKDDISLAADQNGTDVPDSKWHDPTAFVRGGWLVSQLPDGTWFWYDGERTPVPGFREIMHRPILAVQLVHDPQSDMWTMDNGTIGYVAKPAEMLEGFQQLGFCENMCGTFTEVKNYLNTYQDSLSVDTNAPPATMCDALSFGTVFRAAQISADATDIQQPKPFAICPQPRHPAAPRQGCVCSSDGSTCTLDGG